MTPAIIYKPLNMVPIIDCKKSFSNECKEFISLKVQGGIEAAKSAQTEKNKINSRFSLCLM